ncbi:MAG: type II toxin-antitoxin system VapC family toxin [Pseudomonadota bacterium]|nr:type II toxin-antitoxin system VapC family toxin [Pseudomonadota bacterium]
MLVDTDVLIWYLRGCPKAAQLLDSLAELKLSAVTYIELAQGCRNKQELGRLKRDFTRRKATILPITEAISNRAIALIEQHALTGGLQLADALIAATALEHALILVTANTRHFRPIPGLSIQAFAP